MVHCKNNNKTKQKSSTTTKSTTSNNPNVGKLSHKTTTGGFKDAVIMQGVVEEVVDVSTSTVSVGRGFIPTNTSQTTTKTTTTPPQTKTKPNVNPTKPPTSTQNTLQSPLVSVCTPTFNRRPFIPIMLECFRQQTYPRNRMEWIIVDDGTDKIQDLLDAAPDLKGCIKYFPIPQKMTLGRKRNKMHEYCKGEFIVYMDDDDYYPPQRVEHAVETLQKNSRAMCAGSSIIHIYFKHIQKMMRFGPYGDNHSTAGTFAFRRELLKQTRYSDDACLAEERQFLKDYTVPFVQLDPMKTILVISHIHNTFDKRRLLENNPAMGQPMATETALTVADFIHSPQIRAFFLVDIEKQLAQYSAGLPEQKPDVLRQMKTMDEEREKMFQQMQQQPSAATIQQQQQQINQFPALSIQLPHKEAPVVLKIPQMVQMLCEQDDVIHKMSCRIQQLDQYTQTQAATIHQLQQEILGLKQRLTQTTQQQQQQQPAVLLEPPQLFVVKNKSDPEC